MEKYTMLMYQNTQYFKLWWFWHKDRYTDE